MTDPRGKTFREALDHHRAGRLAQAREMYQEMLRTNPDDPNGLHHLGLLEHQTGNDARAAQMMARSIAIAPDVADFHANFGQVLHKLGLLPAAQRAFERAIALKPDFADAHNNLGNLLRDLGDTRRSIDCFLRSLQLDPSSHVAHSNALLAMHSLPCDRKTLFDEHLRWAKMHGLPDAGNALPQRPVTDQIRVGYVSADFRHHPTAFFIEPILACHDRKKFEIFCYSNSDQSDDYTQRMKSCADHWRDIIALSDEQLTEQVRKDDLNILIDLSGHTAGNRLVFFSRRHAPVQITYLGCADTTGLSTIDYRITDHTLDPPGSEPFYSERLVRLPRWMSCYRPPDNAPAAVAGPASRGGPIAFATSAKLDKLSPECLATWRRVLENVPESRLLVMSVPSDAPGVEQRVRNLFRAAGIRDGQIILFPRRAFQEYLAAHAEADIMLDSFPFAGHTVTCHALWMGVPVVTLRGQSPVGRLGAEVLENVGLPDLIAESEDEFVRIVVDLANDRPRLASIRQNLRAMMERSALLDATGFTREFEECLKRLL